MSNSDIEAARKFFGVGEDYTGDINFESYARFAEQQLQVERVRIAEELESILELSERDDRHGLHVYIEKLKGESQ
jgi:hypothetical protein